MIINKHQDYSQLGLAIDLVVNEYEILNPIEIVELIQKNLGLYFTIHQVLDYLDINFKIKKKYEKSLKQKHNEW